MTRLIVGLGNPGPAYVQTRHNVGFMLAERLAGRWKAPLKQKACQAVFGEGEFDGRPVKLALPQTFMNSSGESVACLLDKWKLRPEEALVVCDDVALPLGSIRVRGQGSAGGHNGLESIIERTGTEGFARLRIGIRTESPAGKDLSPFVLGPFTKQELKLLEQALGLAVEACEVWVSQGVAEAMNRFNRKIKEGN